MWRLVIVACVGCGRIGFGAGASDAIDGAMACTEPFTTANVVASNVKEPSIRFDELELFASFENQLLVATRSDPDVAFGAFVPLVIPANPSVSDAAPSISGDGLDLFFTGSIGGRAPLMITHRATIDSAFGSPTDTGASGVGDVSADGQRFYSHDLNTRIRVFSRTGPRAFGNPIDLAGPVNDGEVNANVSPSIATDELTIYFESNRAGGTHDFVATRASVADPFGDVVIVDVTKASHAPEISANGHRLYFQSDEEGVSTILVSTRCE